MTNEDWDNLRAIASEAGCRVGEAELLALLIDRARARKRWTDRHDVACLCLECTGVE